MLTPNVPRMPPIFGMVCAECVQVNSDYPEMRRRFGQPKKPSQPKRSGKVGHLRSRRNDILPSYVQQLNKDLLELAKKEYSFLGLLSHSPTAAFRASIL